MDETSTTTTLNETSNTAAMKGTDATENLEADDLIFFNSLRTDLDLLKRNPSAQTIHNILDYSRSSR
ncbi:hypothetical protein [Mucilaginibacter ginsenosidivorans]|uniref:Uncharacterized protein n=1 Tax=Mucilaginibacter ginsenosidivorans TaxID=398053 RepID=A0A5B8UUQ6_9SPHI|nr:hypothetical protein [Mucilaginibacter ginsenosidivorans]QEC62860.1 hypothetical protein FRZ54_09810 [Mucilaginibacter ginsenosidivorans]